MHGLPESFAYIHPDNLSVMYEAKQINYPHGYLKSIV